MSLAAHLRTVWPVVRRGVAGAPEAPASEPWSVAVPDPDLGAVRLTGRLHSYGSPVLLVLVHGLGGSVDSTYMLRAASVAESLGVSALRLNLRGADRHGEDFYHAGLSSDLEWVLSSPELERFESILIFGFSLGGHVSLRFATEVRDPRLRAVAAASTALDLDRCVAAIDRPSGWIYRRYMLAGLCRMYSRVAARRELPLTPAEARRIRTLREWDRRTVVPRFGFASPEDYYATAGVGSRLDRLQVPALLVVAEDDPMVPPDSVYAGLTPVAQRLQVRWVGSGGHLAFSAGLDLGEDAPLGLTGQVVGWLLRMIT